MEMEKMRQDIVDEEVRQEGFKVDDASKAEWALKKIAEDKLEMEKFQSVCKAMIEEYQSKIHQAEQRFQASTNWLKLELKEYFNTQKKKVTKTQESVKLPSGTLKLKYSKPKFVRNEELLTKWLKENKLDDFVKVKETADWAGLKKTINVSGDSVITEDGEIVEGIVVEQTEPEFVVEV